MNRLLSLLCCFNWHKFQTKQVFTAYGWSLMLVCRRCGHERAAPQ